MVSYILVFVTLVIAAFIYVPTNTLIYKSKFTNALFLYTILLIFVGLRYQTGGDWYSYEIKIIQLSTLEFYELLAQNEPGFSTLAYLMSWINEKHIVINVICATIFLTGIIKLGVEIGYPSMVMLLSFPFLIIVVGMGYVRQSVALGFLMIGIVNLSNGRNFSYFIYCIAAGFFHSSSIIMLLLGFTQCKIYRNYVLIGILFTVFGCFFYFSGVFDEYYVSYVSSENQSGGVWYRLVLLDFSALIFLIFRTKFPNLNQQLIRYCTAMSLIALAFPFILLITDSTIGIDRFSIYLYPLQLITYTSLVFLFKGRENREIYVLLVSINLLIVLMTWISYSPNASDWLPYRSVLEYWF